MEATKQLPVEEVQQKNDEKKLKRKRRRKKVRNVLLAVLIVIVLFFLITGIITQISKNSLINKVHNFSKVGDDTLSYEYYGDGLMNIYSDRGLKVMQLTDIHIGGGWMSTSKDSMAVNAVAAMITAEKPDFVVVTGDITYPVPFQAGTLNNKNGMRIFAEMMETLGVYWTVSYGNHDTELYSFYSREEMTEYLESDKFPHCLLQAGPEDVDGVGNQVINIVNSDGIITRSLILLDSHTYVDGDYTGLLGKYDNIHQNQVDWYCGVIDSLRDKNAQAILQLDKKKQKKYSDLIDVPTSLFFHIPLTEFADAWNEYVAAGYQDTENLEYNYGTVGEKGSVICCGIHDDNLFEAILEKGSTDTVFCGHDHLNNFSAKYKGVYLTYGMSIDYLAYSGIFKIGSQRGCTIIRYDKHGGIRFQPENYYQDKYVSYYEKEQVEMQKLGHLD